MSQQKQPPSLLEIQAEQARETQRRGNSQNRRQTNRSTLPLETGVIASLKESFGFIKSVERDEDIFFHSSETSEDLQIGDEVQFRINHSQRSAHQLKKLPPGTVVWEVEENPGVRFKGLVERPPRFSASDGTIRVLVADSTDETILKPHGPLVRVKELPTSTGKKNVGLARGDLVEFNVLTEKRTSFKYARNLRVLVTEKERKRKEEEEAMLQQASEEQGVVAALKGEYGFLKSNKRREEVYFHYSNIQLEEHEEQDEFVLQEGQEMKFLVVKDGSGSRARISARLVKLQPQGSVKFHDHVATGITGTLLVKPQPQDAGHKLDQQGKIRLFKPIVHSDDEGNEVTVEEVYLFSKDSPGGSFSFHNGSAIGVWVEVGDTLLFDIVRDVVDGAYRAAPTKYHTPKENPLDVEADDDEKDKAVRLIELSLVMRAEGEINAVKDSYGFIQFAERPVDVHFRLYQLLPDELQDDIRLNMGYANVDNKGRPLRLRVGAEVTFDLSIHGLINNGASGKRTKSVTHERENLKAQRVLLLPPKSIEFNKVVASSISGVIVKEDPSNPYAGNIELEKGVPQMRLEERHPLIADMIRTFVESDWPGPLKYHDLQSVKDDDVVIELAKVIGKGKLRCSHMPISGETQYKGLLCITKEDVCVDPGPSTENALFESGEDFESGDDVVSQEHDEAGNLTDKRSKNRKSKAIKNIRYDRSSLSSEAKDSEPPTIGDKAQFDLVQSRRTGAFFVQNMTIIERHIPALNPSKESGMGIVKEVVSGRGFGLISVLDEAATKRETLFFHLSNTAGRGEKQRQLRKGDEVEFSIATERNGKRVALDVKMLPRGTIISKTDKNACKGFILLEPTNTIHTNNSLRHSSNASRSSDVSSSRWNNVDENLNQGQTVEPLIDQGCILLIEDPTNQFGLNPNSSIPDDDDSHPVDKDNFAITHHLRYKNGAVAIIGAGPSSESDNNSNPRRGDMVSFMKTKNGKGVRGVRIVKRKAATIVRGSLVNIEIKQDETIGIGRADFNVADEKEKKYAISLDEVLSCDPLALKENEEVEGILHENAIYGICRTSDLYLESKLGSGLKQRPKLNLIVRKDRGGTIVAQSKVAKGPDGTNGFQQGWTKRTSKYSQSLQQITEADTSKQPSS